MRTVIAGIVAPGTVLAIGVGAAQQALAATPPEHYRTTDIGGLPDIDCGTFTISETSVSGHYEKTAFFDDAGDPVRVIEHYSSNGVLTNLTTGKTLKDKFEENDVFTVVGDDWTVVATSGITYHYTEPHLGVQIAVVGRWVKLVSGEVLFEAGPHDEFELTALCPLLA